MVIDKQRVGQANSVGPIRSSRLDRNVKKRKQSVCIAISVGPTAHLGLTETLRRETERLQSHLGETEIPIGRTDLLRVCGSGYDFWNRWRRIGRIGVTDFGFGFRSFVDVGK